eukprot:1144125-Pelagomonas_calceolata.AAC.2
MVRMRLRAGGHTAEQVSRSSKMGSERQGLSILCSAGTVDECFELSPAHEGTVRQGAYDNHYLCLECQVRWRLHIGYNTSRAAVVALTTTCAESARRGSTLAEAARWRQRKHDLLRLPGEA